MDVITEQKGARNHSDSAVAALYILVMFRVMT